MSIDLIPMEQTKHLSPKNMQAIRGVGRAMGPEPCKLRRVLYRASTA